VANFNTMDNFPSEACSMHLSITFHVTVAGTKKHCDASSMHVWCGQVAKCDSARTSSQTDRAITKCRCTRLNKPHHPIFGTPTVNCLPFLWPQRSGRPESTCRQYSTCRYHSYRWRTITHRNVVHAVTLSIYQWNEPFLGKESATLIIIEHRFHMTSRHPQLWSVWM